MHAESKVAVADRPPDAPRPQNGGPLLAPIGVKPNVRATSTSNCSRCTWRGWSNARRSALSARILFQELRATRDYRGGYDTVRVRVTAVPPPVSGRIPRASSNGG